MKTFQELTREEKLALTDEQTQRFLDIHLAEHGYTRLEPLRPAPAFVAPPADEVPMFQIRSEYTTFDLAFPTEKAAFDFLKLGPVKLEHNWSAGTYTLSSQKNFSVAPIQVRMSDAGVTEARKAYEKDRELWNKEKKDHEEAAKKIAELDDVIQDELRTLRQEERDLQRVRDTFSTFLKLADDNREIAKKFLRQKYADEAIALAGIA